MVVKIVLGLNYGDEGKGQMVDYFSHQAAQKGHSVLNVMSNGSCQRGHTVELLDGTRHVFHHFGSGSFVGAATYCPKQFLVNPIIFNQEWEELKRPLCICNVECPIVTPYHMIVNQTKEKIQKHGSCGMGVWETVQLPLLRVEDVVGRPMTHILWKLREIRFTLGGQHDLPDIYWSEDLLWSFLIDCCKFADRIKTVVKDRNVILDYDVVIFENGQGLLLDQKLPDKDHLTPSNTDLTNPKEILRKARVGEDVVETCYVTRSYMTRHGNGPFPTECNKEEISDLIGEDKTNRPNEWQGSLRYGRLDDFTNRIERFGKTSLAITHMNEHQIHLPDGFDEIYLSDGFTRESVTPQINT